MLKVPTKALLLVAALVWLIAGAAVVSVGVDAAEEPWTPSMALGFLIVYLFFFPMFLRLCRKHTKRIRRYTEELTNLAKFLDPPAYIIILVMIGIGISVRISELVPPEIIAFFYSGLGSALITAAIVYILTYIAICEELTTNYQRPMDFYKKFE